MVIIYLGATVPFLQREGSSGAVRHLSMYRESLNSDSKLVLFAISGYSSMSHGDQDE